MSYKILAIMGQAGAGKDSFMNALVQSKLLELKPIIHCTTRPIRDNEQDGVNYYFLDPEDFAEQVINGQMIQATVFNDWCYGTSVNSLSENVINVGVFNPAAIEILQEHQDIEMEIVYITASDKTRLLRQLSREKYPDCEEIVRRYHADKKDFSQARISNIEPTYEISNEGGTSLELLAQTFVDMFQQRSKLIK